MNKTQELLTEFDRQINNLKQKDYPNLEGVGKLREKLNNLELPDIDLEKGRLPFVIVVKSSLITAERMMGLVKKDGKEGTTALQPCSSENFKTIDDVTIPDSEVYLLVDIDRGKQNINLPPKVAMEMIKDSGRSPLTIDEGIAIVTQFSDFLIKNNCFSLLASRTGKDKRVPAIWINAKKQPNLGWCWDGNPHTWLGSASAKDRIGV